MALNTDNQVVTLTANTVSTVDVPSWYNEVVVTNGGADAVLVQTSSSTVSATNFQAAVAPNSSAVVANAQPRQPVVSPTAPGSTVQNTGYQGSGGPQANLNQTAGGANHTIVSLLSAAATSVELAFQ